MKLFQVGDEGSSGCRGARMTEVEIKTKDLEVGDIILRDESPTNGWI